MSDSTTHSFCYSKGRIIHVAINIALSPVLFIVVGVWSWPPTGMQALIYLASFLAAVAYSRYRWQQPVLFIDDNGIRGKKSFEFASLEKCALIFRSLRLKLSADKGGQEEVLNLNWASKEDIQKIVALVNQGIESRSEQS